MNGVLLLIAFLAGFASVWIADCYCCGRAAWPWPIEKTLWVAVIPGSGFYGVLRYGWKKEEETGKNDSE